MFKADFKPFVCEGDRITCTVDGLDCTATLYVDDDDRMHRPDQRQDGFWPSLNPGDAGYIGPKSRSTLARHMAHAKDVMRQWEQGEWQYFGVAVTVEKNGVQLTHQYGNALWGIEGNYPSKRKANPNKYFRTVANELLPDALSEAKAKLESLCDCEKESA